MSAHTPGPWSVLVNRQGYPYQIHAINGDNTKTGTVGTSVTRWASIALPSSAEGKANALLIAAAPELLAALRLSLVALELVNVHGWILADYESSITSAMDAARAAIKHATGEGA